MQPEEKKSTEPEPAENVDKSAPTPVPTARAERVPKDKMESEQKQSDETKEEVKEGDIKPEVESKEVNVLADTKEEEVLHYIKRLRFFRLSTFICLQNQNGPCPLLCIANILFLRGILEFPKNFIEPQVMPSNRLVELVANYLLETHSSEAAKSVLMEKTLADVINILPSLQTGLDVNVMFNATDGFEFSPVISVFDLLHIRLLHGWLADPEDKVTYPLVKDLSYNKLTDAIVTSTEETPELAVMRGYLDDTRSQLTMHGLSELYSTVREDELFALFRNNHFHVGYKTKEKIYLLLTDEGYRQSMYCWEELSAIDGDTQFVAYNFGGSIREAHSNMNTEKTKHQLENPSTIDPTVIEAQRRELARLKAQSKRENRPNNSSRRGRQSNRGSSSKGCVIN